MMPFSFSDKDVLVFDLDDTLYKEIDYLHSAYKDIAKWLWGRDWNQWYLQMLDWYLSGQNVFAKISEIKPDVSMDELLNKYRFEKHDLVLSLSEHQMLLQLQKQGVKLGIMTDGRQVTQMNKIKALGLDLYFSEDMIVISETFGSEKPSERNYRYYMDKCPGCRYTYVGDNIKKDFIAANRLGWNTICLLDNGQNIHRQDFSLDQEYLPKAKIQALADLGESHS